MRPREVQPSKARSPMLVRPSGRLVSAREVQLAKAQWSMLVRPSAEEGVVADAGEAVGQAGQRKGDAAPEGVAADAGQAVGEAGQREGGAAPEGVVADAGEACRQGDRDERRAVHEGVAWELSLAFWHRRVPLRVDGEERVLLLLLLLLPLRPLLFRSAYPSAAAAVAAHNVDQVGPEARAPHRLERSAGHTLTGLAQEPLRHRHEAHVLHHGKQLGLGPLGGLPPPHAPLEDGLLTLGHQPVLLHQRQHLRSRRQLRRQLLEAAQRRLHRGLLERRQREDIGEPPHVERVGRRDARPDRVGARLLERVDHQARGRLEHLGQQALLDLTFALVDEGQQRLERLRRMPSSAWVASAASRMPDSKRFRKYFELEASATRCALNSTPSAETAKSVSLLSRQRPASEGWYGTPPLNVSVGTAVTGGEDDVVTVLTTMLRC
eukprot:scaffold28351_cov52-Phaeocystis_antarctica.AAC.3